MGDQCAGSVLNITMWFKSSQSLHSSHTNNGRAMYRYRNSILWLQLDEIWIFAWVAILQHRCARGTHHLTISKTAQMDSFRSQSPSFVGRRKREWYLRGRGSCLSCSTSWPRALHPNGLDPLTLRAENVGWDLLQTRSFLFSSVSLYLILYSSRFRISYMFL